MMLLVFGIVMMLGAILCGFAAFSGPASAQVSKERISGYVAAEQKSVLTRIADSLVAWVDATMRRRGWRPFTATELELAGVKTPVPQFVVLMSCGVVTSIAVGLLMLGSFWLGLLLAVLVPVGGKIYLRIRTSRRRRNFADQLPQALQLMASSLRAGHSLMRSMDAVARDSESPMSDELGRVINETRIGRDLLVALEDVARRMESKDFSWVAMAIEAQRQTGGNLNEILDQVAETIRDRTHIRQQVNTLSAEGRLSAYILMALPLLIGGYYTLVASETMSTFIDSGIGKLLMLGSLIMYVLGGFWMRSIVRIEF